MAKKEERKKEKEALWKVCKEIHDELRTIGIPVDMPDVLGFRKGKKGLGSYWQTTISQGDDIQRSVRIYINRDLKGHDRELRSTLAHELLHGVDYHDPRCVGHNAVWRAYLCLGEWKYHYGLFEYADPERYNENDDLYQCPTCGFYTRYRLISQKQIMCCSWCRKRIDPVNQVDHSFEEGLSRNFDPETRKYVLKLAEELHYPTEGIAGFENSEEPS